MCPPTEEGEIKVNGAKYLVRVSVPSKVSTLKTVAISMHLWIKSRQFLYLSFMQVHLCVCMCVCPLGVIELWYKSAGCVSGELQ